VKTNLLFFTKGRPTGLTWEFSKLLPARTDGEHSWTAERKEIEARGYDLKAVNPHLT
jgi:type I restriction enzyme M protein